MKTLKKGLFITLEGGEGSGKTTLAKKLKEYYESLSYEVVLTREPGGTELGEKIRNYVVNEELNSTTELLLFSAVRRNHILTKILPALDSGKIVICDRYITSTFVYQGIMGKIPLGIVDQFQDITITPPDRGRSIYPDIEILLDIDPEVGLKRIENRDGNNKFDLKGINYHKRVNKAYKEIFHNSRYNKSEISYIIDASNDQSVIESQARNYINAYINDLDLEP